MNKRFFQEALLRWYSSHKRDLPWRNSSDPYIIWISEVILQQTRVNQGLPYFLKFQENYPTVTALANAPETRVLKDWEGLGYYSRARNLHAAAKEIAQNLNGKFPDTHAEILKLKGVGDYTAAAISSFVFNEPHAVVDGNVYRVLARVFGLYTPINTSKGKKVFAKLAEELLCKKDPANYNQAIMEFGALQCTPKNPDCSVCPLQSACYAFAENKVGALPAKENKRYDRQRYFNYAVVTASDKVLVEQRTGKDVWKKLHQFPLVEASGLLEKEKLITELHPYCKNLGHLTVKGVTDLKPHKLSHQTIHCRIVELNVDAGTKVEDVASARWISKSALDGLAFPRPLRQFLDRKQLTLPFKP